MALGFPHAINHDLIFRLTRTEFGMLKSIFTPFFYHTGINFDFYQDQRPIRIIELVILLKFFIPNDWDLRALAD